MSIEPLGNADPVSRADASDSERNKANRRLRDWLTEWSESLEIDTERNHPDLGRIGIFGRSKL